MTVQNPPEGYPGVTPYLSVRGADAAIAWYQKVLGAELVYRMEMHGAVGHAELKIGGGHIMLADEFPELDHLGPRSRGGTTVHLLVYVANADSTHALALSEGAVELHPLETKLWGDRSSTIEDPFGHRWTVATHVEDVPWDEVDRRMAASGEGGG